MEGDTEISFDAPSTSRQYRNFEQAPETALSLSPLKNKPAEDDQDVEADISQESPLRQINRKPQTATDRERFDAGKQALRKLLQDKREKKNKKKSCASILKVYITILAALLIIGGLFILIFLIPMTIDPALATLVYDIDPNPALCMTNNSLTVNPILNKTWCSCSEGCTKDIYSCHQIMVRYRKGFLQLNTTLQADYNITAFSIRNEAISKIIKSYSSNYYSPLTESSEKCGTSEWMDNDECWHSLNASLLVNIKGCGYPPYVNCSVFLESYHILGRRYLCYYSKLNPSIVITNYDPNKPWDDLIQSLLWTCGSQVIGTIILIALHCPFKSACKSISDKDKKAKATKAVDRWKKAARQPAFNKDWYEVNT